MSPTERKVIERLNILLEVPTKKKPNWGELRKKLVYAIYDRKAVTSAHRVMFTPESMYQALDTIHYAVQDWRIIGATTLGVKAHNMVLYAPTGQPITAMYDITDCDTAVIVAFRYLIEKANVGVDDILSCGNSRCGKSFVPVRKPAKGRRAYCGSNCARLVAMWDYRQRKRDELREKEKRRSNQRYKKKCAANYKAKLPHD